MAKVNSGIFKEYDIRGIYRNDFDEEFARDFGNKLCLGLSVKNIVVGHDGTTASRSLVKALLDGLLSAGTNIIFLDACTTPIMYFAVNIKGANAGIMVTASHNPNEYSGFKVVGENAAIIGGNELKKIYEQTRAVNIQSGNISQYNAVDEYSHKVVGLAGSIPNTCTVAVTGPEIVKSIFKKIGEKTNLEIIEDIHGVALRIQVDQDGDRIAFFEGETRIEADLIFLLVAEKMGYKRVVHELRFSQAVRDRLRELSVQSIVSKVGRLNLYEAMRKNQADFGGEYSGHFYFKDFYYLESPELMLLHVCNIVRHEGKNLPELIKPYQVYYRQPEISFPYNPDVLRQLEEKYSDGKIDKLDGLTVEYTDWWFNLRPSNTEPLMRLVVEAKTKELLDQKVSELREVLSG